MCPFSQKIESVLRKGPGLDTRPLPLGSARGLPLTHGAFEEREHLVLAVVHARRA